MIGTRLGNRYEIIGELGRGGMGVVYRARDPLLNREVAVKVLPQAQLTPQAEERFRREAQLVAQMDHPAIVPIYDIGQEEGAFFFLMPVVRGTNLRMFVREHPRSLGEILDVVIQVADALEYSHGRGIVHRDIKPENVMVSQEEGSIRARVMDFGLAKAASENRLTKTGTLVGTVSYLSPEQVVARDIDGRSDIYSLGTLLFECLSGDPPFTGETQSILYRIVHENPRSLRSMGLEISEELDEIVLKSLAKEKNRRFQTASEMADALRRFQAHLHDSERNRSIVLSTTMTAQFARPQQTRFIGREKEFGELQRRLNAAIDGECQFAVVAGEPGIGKSRLLEELENLAKARRIRVLHGRFVEQDRTFSYQGFCEVIQEYFRSRDTGSSGEEHADFSDLASDLMALFPVLSEITEIRSAASLDGAPREPRKADDRTYLYELLARTLTRIAGGKPLLLIFENLHGAEVSLEALQYVVRRLGPTPTLIVGTYRQTEIDKRHPLVKMLDAFSDDSRFVSILLGPFSPSEHRQLVETMVGGELSGELTERLFQATEANPFFTKELVRSLIDSGGISRGDDGAWTLSGEMAISSDALPATIQQAVEKRIERLPEDVREVLSIASVLGKTFEFRDLELLSEGKGDIDDIVERLVYEGLVEEERESRGDRLTFSSGIVRDVLYAGLSRRKRKSLHRRYAEYLEKRFDGRLERIYPQLVHHFAEGDVPEKTVSYGVKAAQRAIEAFSPDHAIEVIRTVLDFLEDDELADSAVEGEARMLYVTAARMSGNVDVALREAESASKVFEKTGRLAESARALLAGAETAWQARRVEETRRWLSTGTAMARRAKENEVLARLLSLAATVANLRGEYDQAQQYLDEAEALEGKSGREAQEVLPEGGRLVVGLANPVRASEPAQTAIIEETEIIAAAFETLTTSDEHGHLIPLLCEKWESAREGHSLIITLRPEVRFHDGSRMTAGDVKTSIQQAIRERSREMSAAFNVIRGVAEYRAGTTDDIAGLVVLGDQRLEIQITEALPIYPALLTDPATGIVKRTPDGQRLGTGPFRIESFAPDRILLKKNPDYWRGSAPRLEELEFRTLSGAATMAAQLRSGEIDLARDLLLKDMEEVLRDPRFRAGLVETPKKTTYFLAFNTSAPLAGVPGLRRAMSGVLRLHDVVWRTLGRIAQPATGVIPPGILGHDAGRRRTPMTREQAIDMVRATGLELPVRLKAALHPLYQDRYRALTDALFDSWAELGIEITNETRSMEEFLARFGDSEGLDLIMTRWNADFDDPDNFTNGLFHSGTGVYSSYFSSPETNELAEQARAETRPEIREMLYRKFEMAATSEAAAIIPLFHEIDYRIAGPRVRGLQLRSTPPYVNFSEIAKTEEGRAGAVVRQTGGVLHVPIAEEVDWLDPAVCYTVEKGEVITTMFDTLTRCVEGARIVPWLASEMRAEEGGKRFHFRLRDDVRFHDGRRMTSRDVRFSWERFFLSEGNKMKWMLTPIRGARALIAGQRKDLEGFHILSGRDFVVELETPIPFFAALLVHPCTAIVQEGAEIIDATARDRCVGSGAFRVVRFEPGQRLELERNPNYWREGLPRADGLIFQFGVRAEEARDEFLAGRFSVASGLFPADVEAFRHNPELASGYREVPRLSIYFAALNIHRRPFDDVAYRRRLLRGLDIAGIVRRTLGRMAIPAHGVIPPGLAGYVPNPSPARHTSDGAEEPPRREIIELEANIHPMFFSQFSALATELSSAFQANGIRLKMTNRSMAEYLQTQSSGDMDLSIGRWVADYPDADTFAYGLLHSTSGALGPFCGYPALDELIERGRVELDPAARQSIYREFNEMVIRDAPLIPLFHEQVYRFVRPDVEGLALSFVVPEVAYESLGMQTMK